MYHAKTKEQVIRAYKKRRKATLALRVTFTAYVIAFVYFWLAVKQYPPAYYIHLPLPHRELGDVHANLSADDDHLS